MLHDVHKGSQTKEDVIKHLHLKEPTQAVVAQEPYGHQEGSHIHIFYRLSNPSDFKTQLKHWTLWFTSGRVQVDVMRGDMAQACRYLSQEDTKKLKDCDVSPYYYPTKAIAVSSTDFADKWLDWWLSTPIAEDTSKFQKVWSMLMAEPKTTMVA